MRSADRPELRYAAQWALASCIVLGCGGDDARAVGDGSTSGGDSTTSATDPPTTTGADETGSDESTTGAEPPPSVVLCDDDDIEARIDEVLTTLSINEKAELLYGANLLPVDGTWLVEGNEAAGIPGFHMLDGPRGVSAMADVTATAFPVAMLRGATWDPQLEHEVGVAMAREIRATGADVILAPTINILRHPGWGRAQETYSEDTHHMGALGVAFIEGVQSQNVVATAKHFAVNSIEDTRFDVNVTIDEVSLREVYLPHFRRAVQDAKVAAVMSAYNKVNGLYCDENPHLLTDILKDEWGFSGLVMSDWIFGTHQGAGSLQAGLDIEMPNGTFFSGLPGSVDNGTLGLAELDAAVRRVIRVQWCFDLDTEPAIVDASQRETPEHLALARDVARRGMVLLRNEGALPLELSAGAEVVVVGALADHPNIGDLGSSAVEPTHVVTALEGIVSRADQQGVNVTHIGADALMPGDDAVIAAADAVIVVAGLTDEDEGEGLIAAGDRDSLQLRTEQVALIEAVAALGAPTSVVLYGGGTIVVSDWVDAVDALMLAFYPGSEGGHALADLLFGDASPSGRLPFSVPMAEGDLPPFDHVSLEVTYANLHGYRHLDANRTPPHYAFGHGLSYTTFELSEPVLSSESLDPGGTLTATVEVTNTGDVQATQTVQLYVGRPGADAPRELRAFGQIALDAGDSGTVELEVSADDLRRYDETDGWVLDVGPYLVEVGTSAGDIASTTMVTVLGP